MEISVLVRIEAPEIVNAINSLVVVLSGKALDVKPTDSPITSVPVASAPQYTIEQIMKAGAALMDAGKIQELRSLIKAFNVDAVTSLAPEQLGAFATELRKLGGANMNGHALLSPSSAYRWLNCTRAPRLEATLPNKISSYAEEGTIAHNVCEIIARKHFKKNQATDSLNELKSNKFWNNEMLRTADIYVEHLAEKAMAFKTEPYIAFEVEVDISDYVPQAFGYCDCVMFSDDTLIITDYKHGKGVSVSAKENPQMMLYALGTLKLYQPILGNSVKKINICIDQPRIDIYESWELSKDELLSWGESIKPIAQKAFAGIGEFKSGEWCRFCKANGICKAQAISAFDDFKDEIKVQPALLTPEEISTALKNGKNLLIWYESFQKVALEKILDGDSIPDYKVVEGRSQRTWTNQDEALETLLKAGVDKAIIYDTVPKSLAQLEKMLGVTKFTELVGQFVVKPHGKPTLASADDKRPIFNSAINDFKNV